MYKDVLFGKLTVISFSEKIPPCARFQENYENRYLVVKLLFVSILPRNVDVVYECTYDL